MTTNRTVTLLVILGSLILGSLGLYAFVNRYSYQLVQILPGLVYETRRDQWTGDTCVTYTNYWERVPAELYSCDPCKDDLDEFVRRCRQTP